MQYIAHPPLPPLPLFPDPEPRTTLALNSRTVEMFAQVFSKREREDLERSMEAVARRRALRLIWGAQR